MNVSLIELVKNKKIKELENIIKKDKEINLNVKDENYNYFIYYVLLYNLDELLDLVLKRNVRLDILDSDGRNILYTPIKFSYNTILKKLLIQDSENIGIGILDIKDKLGLTALQYSIIFNNYNSFILLLENNANYLINNNQELNSFHIAIQYDRLKFFISLLNKISDINFYTKDKENLIQFCITNDKLDYIQYILKKKININTQEEVNGLTAQHQIIIKNNKNILQQLICYGANINTQDFYGNSCLHYSISEKNKDVINIILKYNPNYNLTNIDGNTPLHMYLSNKDADNFNLDKEILKILIKHTNLNIQNNEGETCLKKIMELYIFNDYKNILVEKELNFFIKDNQDEDISKSLNDEDIFEIAIESFYNTLVLKQDNLIEDWEKWCSKGLIDKLKTIKSSKNEPKDICIDKIRDVIINEKRSLPKYNKMNLILDNGIFMNNCFYTGIPLDILMGLLYLNKTNKNIGLILDYPLTINKPVETYYEKLGIDYPYKIEFSNCEILWTFQKLFYPSYFDFELDKKMKDPHVKFIVIPLGIELNEGSHANILIIDKENKIIERFEPNGSNHPYGLNYNPNLLDSLLENKFVEHNLELLKPSDFLPSIGFQILENLEESKCKKLGDPNGFCGVWCTWWAFHKIKNYKMKSTELAISLIQTIKMENKSFKNIIRNFSYYIVELRDNLLKKFNVDINDWMVSNIEPEKINLIEKEILKNI